MRSTSPKRRLLARVATATSIALLAGFAAVSPASAGDDQGAPTYHSSGLAPTPYMGWNTYYGLGGSFNETDVHSVANFLVSSGLKTAGYDIVWLDGGWQSSTPRDALGNLTADPTRFPSGMAALTTFIHGLGLKAGIYTDAGPYDPAHCGLGSYGHYQTDANQFASWRFDAVKVDFLCGHSAGLDPATVYTQFSQALSANSSGRAMILNLCNPVRSPDWGTFPLNQTALYSYAFGPPIADSWRTSTDSAFLTPSSTGYATIIDRSLSDNSAHPEANGPGHYNDPDYLLPMRTLSGGGYELSLDESKTQLGLWSIMSAPLVIGSDPRTLNASMLAALENPEIIAVDQDPLAIQAVKVADNGAGLQVWSKVLTGTGLRAVALFNDSASAQAITVNFSDTGLSGAVAVRDLWGQTNLGSFTGSYTVTVASHATAMLRLSGTIAAPGTNLGGIATASPAIIRVDDTHANAFARGADGALWENTLSGTWTQNWTSIGGPVGSRILGQPAAYGSTGGRIDVFVRGTDNAIWQRTYTSGTWGAWSSLGGTLTDSASVAWQSPTSWTLFSRGTDGAIWSRTATSGWSSISSPNSQPTYGRPSAVIDTSGNIYVAVRTADDQVYVKVNTSGTWGSWTSLGGTIAGSPTLLSTLGRVYLFARGADYRLWQRNFTSGAWGSWFQRSEFASGSFNGALGTDAGANGTAWVVATDPSGQLHQTVL